MNGTKDGLAELFDDSNFDAESRAGVVDVSRATGPTPLEQLHVESCKACRGTGAFYSYSGRLVGPCFKCKGKGTRVFKTSSAKRLDARNKAAAKKARTAAESLAWYAEHKPELHAWLNAKRATFGFAASLWEAIQKYDQLTEGQEKKAVELMERDKVRDAERAAAHAEKVAAAPQVDLGKITEAFAAAKVDGLYKPKLKIAGFTIKVAPPESRNPGSLYVKAKGGVYVGRITDGRFFKGRDCTPEQEARLLAVCAGTEAAIAHGKATGICAVCGAFLENPESVARGIGPICFAKIGGGASMFKCEGVKQ